MGDEKNGSKVNRCILGGINILYILLPIRAKKQLLLSPILWQIHSKHCLCAYGAAQDMLSCRDPALAGTLAYMQYVGCILRVITVHVSMANHHWVLLAPLHTFKSKLHEICFTAGNLHLQVDIIHVVYWSFQCICTEVFQNHVECNISSSVYYLVCRPA